jgi:hypothetical protein
VAAFITAFCDIVVILCRANDNLKNLASYISTTNVSLDKCWFVVRDAVTIHQKQAVVKNITTFFFHRSDEEVENP